MSDAASDQGHAPSLPNWRAELARTRARLKALREDRKTWTREQWIEFTSNPRKDEG